MSYSAAFRCIAGCPGSYPLDSILYRCPTCEGLLEVAHDLEALRDRSAAAWMRLFDERYKRTTWPYGSSVWGKKEWVCPQIDDNNVVSMDEGGTNLFLAEAFGRSVGVDEVWVKLCGNSHTGSFKDLGMTVLVSMVRQMITNGKQIRAVGTRPPRCPPTRPPRAFQTSSCFRAAKSPSRSSCSRWRMAHWFLPWTPTLTAAWRSSRNSRRTKGCTSRTR